jgi:hypothetical protein
LNAPASTQSEPEAILAHDPVFLPDSPEWHLREEDYASLFEEYLTPDPVESFLNETPIIHLEASSDRAACNMDYYRMDAALGTHEVFSNWNYDQFHNSSVEFTDTTTYPHPLPFEDQCETEIVDVQVSFRVDVNGLCPCQVYQRPTSYASFQVPY